MRKFRDKQRQFLRKNLEKHLTRFSHQQSHNSSNKRTRCCDRWGNKCRITTVFCQVKHSNQCSSNKCSNLVLEVCNLCHNKLTATLFLNKLLGNNLCLDLDSSHNLPGIHNQEVTQLPEDIQLLEDTLFQDSTTSLTSLTKVADFDNS